MSTIVLRSVKGSGLTNNEIDANFTNLNTDKVEAAQTATLTNKTVALGSNTVSGTTAQFNTALTDGDFATLAGTETLTNKTLTNPSYSGATANGGTVTTIDINGGTIDGTVIGGSSAAAGSFTTLSASDAATLTSASANQLVLTGGTSVETRIEARRGTDDPSMSLKAGWNGIVMQRTGAPVASVQAFTVTMRGTTDVVPISVSSTGLAVTGALSATTTATAASFIPSGATVPTNGMYLPSANTLAWSTNSAIKATLDASGNFGLGVTPSAWRTTERGLEVAGSGGSMSALTNTFNETRLYNNAYVNTTPACVYKTTGGASMYRQDTAGVHSWYSAASGTAGTTFTFTQLMTLDASGNLGLGVTPDNGKSACLQLKSGISFPATQVASSDANTLDDYREATATLTATGMTTSPTGTATFVKVGNQVTLNIPEITGTSNTTAFTLTGVPTTMRPAANRFAFVRVVDNGSYSVGMGAVGTSGTITFYKDVSAGSFTSSGTKGSMSFEITYTI